MTKISGHPERADWGTCTDPGCMNHVAIKKYALCNKHYRSLNYAKGKEKGLDLERARAEFWKHVNVTDNPAQCWEWAKAPHPEGHGTYWQNNVSYHAHVVSYLLAEGEVPSDKVIDHKCRNRICVNPNHLHAVTRKQNTENIDLYKNNPSGYRGVTPRKGYAKWRARVGHNGAIIHVGDYDSPEEANEAVVKARIELHTNNLIDRGLNP